MKTIRFLAVVLALSLAALGCSEDEDPNRIRATGTIEATDVTIASKVAGELITVQIEEGASVMPGETLATVDRTLMEVQLREAEAGIAAAQAQLALLRRGARSEDIHVAQAALQQAQTTRDLAASDLERSRMLAKQDVTTGSQLESVEARYRVAQLQVEQASESVQKVRTVVRPEEITAAEARVRQLQATRDRVLKLLDDCTLRAPVSGVITHKLVEQGELVGQGSPIATITDISRVELVLYLPETELPRVRLGQPVDVRVDSDPKKVYTGKIAYISPQAEFTPKNIQTKDDRVKLVFAVKVSIDNPTGALKPGLPADAEIVVN